jgi:hypothetical protein
MVKEDPDGYLMLLFIRDLHGTQVQVPVEVDGVTDLKSQAPPLVVCRHIRQHGALAVPAGNLPAAVAAPAELPVVPDAHVTVVTTYVIRLAHMRPVEVPHVKVLVKVDEQ